MMYLMWHCQRQGWLSASGTTTTALADALRVPRDDALTRCKRVRGHEGMIIIPVREVDVVEVMS